MAGRMMDFVAWVTLRRVWWRSDVLWMPLIGTWLSFIPYLLDRSALQRSQYWSREKHDALLDERLRRAILHAQTLPFWRSYAHPKTVGSWRDYLRELPTVTRADFKVHAEEEYCDPHYLPTSLRDSTSGSTGIPFTFYLDRGALLSSWGLRDRQFVAATDGVRYPIIIFRADGRLRARFYRPHFVYLRSYNDIAERFDELMKFMQTTTPGGAVLYMFPSTALALARYMHAHEKTLPLKAIVAGGEAISSEARAEIERVISARFSLAYGTQESSCIAFECEAQRLHINEEDVFVEILDTHNKPVPDGQEGRVVLTHLGYRVMPLIRYDNGDLGSITPEQCPCGRTLRTISVIGRVPTLIEQKGGYTFTLTELTAIFNKFGAAVSAFQIVHTDRDAFTIRLIRGPLYEHMREDLEGHIARKVHPESKITYESVDSLEASPNGKTKYYVRAFTDTVSAESR